MTRKHLWTIFGWDEKWDKLYSIKKRLTETLQSVNDAAESINTSDDAYQREERAIDMRRLKTEKFQLQRGVKNADEDLKVALDTVDSKDDEATADDREQVELATEALEAATAKLAEVELSLANAIEVSPSVRVFCSLFISLCLSPSLSLSLTLSLSLSLAVLGGFISHEQLR